MLVVIKPTKKNSIKTKDKIMYLQKLFDHMQDEHNVILIQSELQEIFNICQEIANCQDKEFQPIEREKLQKTK